MVLTKEEKRIRYKEASKKSHLKYPEKYTREYFRQSAKKSINNWKIKDLNGYKEYCNNRQKKYQLKRKQKDPEG